MIPCVAALSIECIPGPTGPTERSPAREGGVARDDAIDKPRQGRQRGSCRLSSVAPIGADWHRSVSSPRPHGRGYFLSALPGLKTFCTRGRLPCRLPGAIPPGPGLPATGYRLRAMGRRPQPNDKGLHRDAEKQRRQTRKPTPYSFSLSLCASVDRVVAVCRSVTVILPLPFLKLRNLSAFGGLPLLLSFRYCRSVVAVSKSVKSA